ENPMEYPKLIRGGAYVHANTQTINNSDNSTQRHPYVLAQACECPALFFNKNPDNGVAKAQNVNNHRTRKATTR
ncbi:hypothetical protein A2U01_0082781, partial [Trifolium medium]|nr:hypothetical protein [Trifolium medium]